MRSGVVSFNYCLLTSYFANSAARLRKKGSWFASKFSGSNVLGYRAMWLENVPAPKKILRNNYRVSRE